MTDLTALADELAKDIVFMARERDATCELKYDEQEVLKDAKKFIIEAFERLAARAEIIEECAKAAWEAIDPSHEGVARECAMQATAAIRALGADAGRKG